VKTLILADTHFSAQFESVCYKAIIRLIRSVDRVIINGDFWDDYLTTFDKFVTSDWQQLFPLLKQKQTIYIYGNHDREAFCDKRVKLFSVQQMDKYILETKNQAFLIEHGHSLAKEFEERHPTLTNIFRKFYPWIDFHSQGEGIPGPLIKYYIDFNHRRLWQTMLDQLKGNTDWLIGQKHLLVGHCHFQLSNPELRIQSLGSFRWGWARYGIIDENGLKMFETRYNKLVAKSGKR